MMLRRYQKKAQDAPKQEKATQVDKKPTKAASTAKRGASK